MRRFTKPLDLYKQTLRDLEADKRSIRRGHRRIAEAGEGDYLDLTGGGLPPKITRGQYARRASGRRRGKLPGLPINVQTGKLRRSIGIRPAPGGSQAFYVGPSKAAGRSMWVLMPGGTRVMIARGVEGEVERRWRARNKALIDVIRRSE